MLLFAECLWPWSLLMQNGTVVPTVLIGNVVPPLFLVCLEPIPV